ncbi:MAG TPA: aldolase/citrate lyase family protein [Streptosporangiaceae bacterium]|nr:aldolase/citrate lyase family protein [Streptosporangiaceae bacterium]
MADTPFSQRVRGGEVVFGGWLAAPGPVTAGLLAAGGLDYVVIDLQHGTATEHDLPALTTAIRRAGAAPLGRVRHAHPADIGRALDLGCDGVIVPNVDTAEQAAAVAGACRFPPAGYRSAGGVLAPPELPLCIVMVESSRAMEELPATLALAGVDGIYVGPRDLSYSLGCRLDPEDPVLRPALERIWADCATAGKPAGVHASDGATARLYRENGCRLVTVVADTLAVSRAAATELALAQA